MPISAIIAGVIGLFCAVGMFITADTIDTKIAFGMLSVGLSSQESHDRRIKEIQDLRALYIVFGIGFFVFLILFLISIGCLAGG